MNVRLLVPARIAVCVLTVLDRILVTVQELDMRERIVQQVRMSFIIISRASPVVFCFQENVYNYSQFH